MKKILFIWMVFVSEIIYAQVIPSYESKQLIIKLKEASFENEKINLLKNLFGIKDLDELNSKEGIKEIQQIGNYKITKTFLLIFNNEKNIPILQKTFSKLNAIEYVEPNFIAYGGGFQNKSTVTTMPNDPHFNKQWGLYNNGTLTGVGAITSDADVDMELAWDIETGDPNMIIAVPDSGLKMDHPDIASRIWVNPNEIANNNIDDDNNGLIDDINGWDWINNDNNPSDDHGHGTNVTGIIGAIPNNNNLFTGVNWNSKILPLKVLNASNSGSYAAMTNSIYYAVDNGAKVISFSIGGSSPSTTLYDALTYANTNNVLFIVCMMNNNNNITYYPAGYSTTHSNVMAVGSTDPNDKRSAPFFWSTTSGSSYGNHINVVAPGNYTYGLSHTSNTSSSSYWGGTSQATPLVAGVASLLFAIKPSLTPFQVKNILQNTAEDLKGLPNEDTAGFDIYHGWGRINAFNALETTLSSNENELFQQEFTIVNPLLQKQLKVLNKGNFTGSFQLKIFTLDGKIISEKEQIINQGENTFEINHPTGIYLLEIANQEYKKIFKINLK